MNSSNTISFKDYFGLRNEKETFSIDPEENAQLLVGSHHQQYFDQIYNNIEDKSVQKEGYKAVLFGEFGFGKTHFLHHLKYVLDSQKSTIGLPILPIFIKCNAFPKKASFAELWQEFISKIDPKLLGEIIKEYMMKIEKGEVKDFWELSQNIEIVTAFEVVGTYAKGPQRYNAIRWLRGEKLSTSDLDKIANAIENGEISGSVNNEQQISAIMNILGTATQIVRGKILTFLIDEAERLHNITEKDAQVLWLACLRELAGLKKIGLIFTVGAGTQDEVPLLLVQEEIVTRISISNLIRFDSMDEPKIEEFVKEFIKAMINVNTAEAAKTLSPGSFDETIWPFEQDGFKEFVRYHYHLWQPREIIHNLQRITGTAYRKETGLSTI